MSKDTYRGLKRVFDFLELTWVVGNELWSSVRGTSSLNGRTVSLMPQ